ncbi:MAG TPA: Glu/Leu/Phe/Val dehydrogenase dimerization domain-containing protein [Longimicrobiaceae bacterium]|nr:Glu/Leu/Phe/Val dehydrogenase dimerization domain-containing protein [Longimicrobiaceae bacterium]
MIINPAAPDTATSRRKDTENSRIWRSYGEYLRRRPVVTLEWADSETDARGWLVINSLRGGAAGGGTRMRQGLTRREVVYLAKTMELKFAFSGPPIGGAKSGIDFDPTDPRRAGVLRRWFHAVSPQLHYCYGTGGDLNVDEVLDVIPCCNEIGLLHPQEGIVRGHLDPEPTRLAGILASLDHGVKAPVDGDLGLRGLNLPVADLVTGYGLARSIIRLYEFEGRPLRGARVLVEGFGAVGGPCALYLARAGARIVGIADREKAIVSEEGLDAANVEALVLTREDKCLPRADVRCLRGADRERFGHTPADIFVSAATSGTLDEPALRRLSAQGVETIACGANQPFRETKLGATRVQRAADATFTVIPDVVANCGMARTLSYLMEQPDGASAARIFDAVDDTIAGALQEIVQRTEGRRTGLLAASLEYALDRLDAHGTDTSEAQS